jgi:hypothetical protein
MVPNLLPFAADLNDWQRRVAVEVRELTALKTKMEVESHPTVDPSDLTNRTRQAEPGETPEVRPPDYHMQFAMLFQKLENTEQKIQQCQETIDQLQ